MAIAVESTATANNTSSSVTITKPTGLSTGDLMIAVLGVSAGISATVNTLSGWTLVANQAIANGSANMQYKVADSGDVAASNFTFTATAGSNMAGSILRVSGQASGVELDTSDNDVDNTANSATISFTTTLSPATDGNLLVMVFAANDGNTGADSMSTYTVTGDTLTWTEVLDHGADSGTSDPVFGAAYAVQDTQADLTAYGATISNIKDNHGGIIASFQAQIDGSGSNALFTPTTNFHAPTASSGTTGSNALLTPTNNFPNQSGEGLIPTVWDPTDKT